MLLLNVGPKADGTFTDEETKVLQELGEWMKINGEGIYDTVPTSSIKRAKIRWARVCSARVRLPITNTISRKIQ